MYIIYAIYICESFLYSNVIQEQYYSLIAINLSKKKETMRYISFSFSEMMGNLVKSKNNYTLRYSCSLVKLNR